MKKLLIKLASGLVLEILIDHAIKQLEKHGHTLTHYTRWTTILEFLKEIKEEGLPL